MTTKKAQAKFMAGKAFAADMIAQGIALSDGDDGELFATYRGRDVPQTDFARAFIDKVLAQGEPEFTAGFTAALSGYIAAASNALDPDDIRHATYEDCIGGPGVKYAGEEPERQTAEAEPVTFMLDKLDEQLASAQANGNEDLAPHLLAAVQASAQARAATALGATEVHLQQVRRHVFKARSSYAFSEGQITDALRVTRDHVIAANRMLDKVLGGVMIEDRPGDEMRSPLGDLLDRLDVYMDATNHVPGGLVDGDAVEALMQAGVWEPHFEAQEAEMRGHDAGATHVLPALRSGIAAAFAVCEPLDGRWPLLKASLETLDAFLASPEPATQPKTEKAEIARKACMLIRRIANYYRDGHEGSGWSATEDDLVAIDKAAGILLSVLYGDILTPAQLERELADATALSVPASDAAPKAPVETSQDSGSEAWTKIAGEAGSFVSLICDYFMEECPRSGDTITVLARDVQAIHQAASIIMSMAAHDEGLEDALEEAKATASVLLTGMPPKASGMAGVCESQAIPKARITEAIGA